MYPRECCSVFIKSLLSNEMANWVMNAQLFGLFKRRNNNTEHQGEIANALSERQQMRLCVNNCKMRATGRMNYSEAALASKLTEMIQ